MSTASVSTESVISKPYGNSSFRKNDRFNSQLPVVQLPSILPYSINSQHPTQSQVSPQRKLLFYILVTIFEYSYFFKLYAAYGYPIVMIYAPPENYMCLDSNTSLLASAASETIDQNYFGLQPSPSAVSLQGWVPPTVDAVKANESASTPIGPSSAPLFARSSVFHFGTALPSADDDVLLQSRIRHQIEFYFSENNLVRDTFLRSHMDEDGWVQISVIAKFNRVASLCTELDKIINVSR